MTPEELEKLTPRELDALIADKVMELPGVGYYKRESCRTSHWVPCAKGEFTEDEPAWEAALYWGWMDTGPVRAVPLYTKLIEPAWEVIEKLREKGYQPMIYVEINGEWRCQLNKGTEAFFNELGPTAELAICRAALRAAGILGK